MFGYRPREPRLPEIYAPKLKTFYVDGEAVTAGSYRLEDGALIFENVEVMLVPMGGCIRRSKLVRIFAAGAWREVVPEAESEG